MIEKFQVKNYSKNKIILNKNKLSMNKKTVLFNKNKI